MRANVGAFDRPVRTVIGILLIAYAVPIGFPITGWNRAGWIGVIPILTAALRNCPAYRLLGFSTCPAKPAHH